MLSLLTEVIRSGENTQGFGSVRQVLFTLRSNPGHSLWFRRTAVPVTCALCRNVSEVYEDIFKVISDFGIV